MPNIVQQYNFNRISSSEQITQVFGEYWLNCGCGIETVSTGTLGYTHRLQFGYTNSYKIDIGSNVDIIDVKFGFYPYFGADDTEIINFYDASNNFLGKFVSVGSTHKLQYYNSSNTLVATSDINIPSALCNLEFILNKLTGRVDVYLNGDTENKLLAITNQTFATQFRYFASSYGLGRGIYLYDVIIATGASDTIIGNTVVKDYSLSTITANNTFAASDGATNLLTIFGASSPAGDTLYAKAADAPAYITMTPVDLLETDLNVKAVSIVTDWKKYGDGDCNGRIDYTVDGTNTITGSSVALNSSYYGHIAFLGTTPTPTQFDNTFAITLRRTA